MFQDERRFSASSVIVVPSLYNVTLKNCKLIFELGLRGPEYCTSHQIDSVKSCTRIGVIRVHVFKITWRLPESSFAAVPKGAVCEPNNLKEI